MTQLHATKQLRKELLELSRVNLISL